MALYHFLHSVLWFPSAPGLQESKYHSSLSRGFNKVDLHVQKEKISFGGSYKIIMSIPRLLAWSLTENSQHCENFTGHDNDTLLETGGNFEFGSTSPSAAATTPENFTIFYYSKLAWSFLESSGLVSCSKTTSFPCKKNCPIILVLAKVILK